MSYTLTKRIDMESFAAQLVAVGVPSFNIDGNKVYLTGEMTDDARAARLQHIANVEAAHIPTTCTKVSLAAMPHIPSFMAEIEALGATGVGLEHPLTYPGNGYVLHDSASDNLRASIKTTAEAHNPGLFPSLAVDVMVLVVAGDGVATGHIQVSDSRGVGAAGKTVRLRLPPNVTVSVDADSFVLDGAGRATATFGPLSGITGDLDLQFYYASGEADPINAVVRFGTL
jgi:hypothetical protein